MDISVERITTLFFHRQYEKWKDTINIISRYENMKFIFSHYCMKETDFGQSRFGHPDLTIFGQSISDLVCVIGAPKVGAQPRKNRAPKVAAWKGGPRRVGCPKFLAFFPSPATLHFRSFCLSLGVFSLNFRGAPGDLSVFGVLGLSCEALVSL